MYCKHCNKTFSKNDRFCTVCGCALEPKQVIAPALTGSELVRKYGCSKLYFAFAILLVISAVLNLITFNIQNFQLFGEIKEFGLFAPEISIQLCMQMVGIFGQIALWAILLGVWLHRHNCRTASIPDKSGLQIIKVVSICQAIGSVIAAIVLFIVLSSAMTSLISYAYDIVGIIIMMVLLAFFMLPIVILTVIQEFKIASAAKKAGKMLEGDTLYKMPLYSIIFNFIVASLMLLGTLFGSLADEFTALSLISVLPTCATTVMAGILMLRFNDDVKKMQTTTSTQPEEMSPSEQAASILMQDAQEIIETQVDNEETIEDMPQA